MNLRPPTTADVEALLGWYRKFHDVLPLEGELDRLCELGTLDAELALQRLSDESRIWMIDIDGNAFGWFEMPGWEDSHVGVRIQGTVVGHSVDERWAQALAVHHIVRSVFDERDLQRVTASVFAQHRDVVEAYILSGFRVETVRTVPDVRGTDRTLLELVVGLDDVDGASAAWLEPRG